jgi:uncharacterized protein (TIGR02265 family)
MTDPPLNTPPVVAARLERPPVPDTEKLMLTPMDIGLRTIEPYLSPASRAAVQERFGAYLGKPTQPVLVSNDFVDFVAQAGFPDLSLPEARRRMGRLSVAHYGQSILGRIMFAPIRLMGMERVLRQTPRQFAAATNYGTRWVAEFGHRHWRFDCEDELMHLETIVGNLDAVAEMVGARQCHVTATVLAPRHYSFDITWGGS